VSRQFAGDDGRDSSFTPILNFVHSQGFDIRERRFLSNSLNQKDDLNDAKSFTAVGFSARSQKVSSVRDCRSRNSTPDLDAQLLR
jgi:hypothetical protein